MSEARARLGVIGGSGLYEIEGLEEMRELSLETPFGAPSDDFVLGRLEDVEVAFLARHGRGHRLLPTELNFRANVWGMKALGVEWLLSASAVGSLREEAEPLHVVVPDQFIDRTRHRADTFFGEGLVGHVSLADPVCGAFARIAGDALEAAGATVHRGGTYLCMEGPQFSTRAESHLYRSWGASVIGMTNLQEARLAREAEICYATMAFVTDYDCWKEDEDAVSVEAVVARLHENAATAKRATRELARRLPESRACPCPRVLDTALITERSRIPRATIEKLGPVVTRALG